MKLADIPPGSDIAYRSAAKIVAEQVEFELETCRRLLGTEPDKVLELLASTPDWGVFLDDEPHSWLPHFASSISSEESKHELRYLWSAH
jgi:hypothetical protein